MVIPMMPVVSLNTFGTRRLKTSSELAFSPDDAPVSWDSKVDQFDKRLGLVRQQFAKHDMVVRQRWEREVRDVSLYEFYWSTTCLVVACMCPNHRQPSWSLLLSVAILQLSTTHATPFMRACALLHFGGRCRLPGGML